MTTKEIMDDAGIRPISNQRYTTACKSLNNFKMVKQYVVHCKKSRYDVYVGRPNPSIPNSYQNAKWGNPFKIGADGTREDVIKKYEEWFLSQPELVSSAKKELKGKVLACWCSPAVINNQIYFTYRLGLSC
jgi:hypothetical protein